VIQELPTASVVVVNYNTRERTLTCLRSLADQQIRGLEIVVVDNGSTDGSAVQIAREVPEAVMIEAGENLGFARGVNRGVAAASGDYVILLNPDTTVLPGSLEALLEFAVTHPEHGLYGGRTVTPDGDLDPRSCWGAPTLWSLLCFATGASTAFKGSTLLDPESLGSWQRDTVREVPIVTGCLLLMKTEDYRRMGGMDERYFLYGEDADFSLRAAAAGHRPVLVPGAVIVHDVGVSTSSSGQKMCMVMAGKSTLLRQHWASPRRELGLLFLVIGTALRTVLERPAAGSDRKTWTTVWRRRRDWMPGYPHAERALFGRHLRSD